MRCEIAIIKTEHTSYKYNKKICGLYPLERNILTLSKAGFKKIYLDLSDEESTFYNIHIKRHLKRLNGTEIIDEYDIKPSFPVILIPSNLFIQTCYFSNFYEYYIKQGDVFKPILNDDQFLISSNGDFKNAQNLLKKYIIDNTDGFIARKFNKRVSIPMSLLLSKTRIHPNILTIFNIFIGIMSAVFLFFNSYWHIVLGGIFFQLASILDGVDGEVAKFTFKTSKLGGWLDTTSDNLTLFSFLIGASYLSIINHGGLFTIIIIAIMFLGFLIMLSIMVSYLRQYSDSASLIDYDREFIQKLPQNDPLIAFIHRMKYLTKKEFVALFFLFVCLTGKVHFVIIATAFALMLGSIVLLCVNIKYSPIK